MMLSEISFEGIILGEYFGNTVAEYLTALGIMLASIVIGKIAYYFINSYLKALFKKTKSKVDDLLIDAIEEPIVVFIIILGLYAATQYLRVPEQVQEYPGKMIAALIIIDFSWLIIRIVDVLMREIIAPVASKSGTTLDDQLIPILRKGLKIIVIIVALLMVLSNFGFNVTALLAGLGVGGLALALASKDTIENVFGAFAIFLDKPFTLRDRVVVNGVTGDVIEVGLRSTRILTLDNTELYVPNSKIVTSNIENVSKPNRVVVATEKLSITYETETGKLREGISIVKGILAETDGVSKDYPPTVVFNEFGESSLNIWVKYWVDDYLIISDVRDRVNQRIKERFEKAGIEFAYPTKRVYIAK